MLKLWLTWHIWSVVNKMNPEPSLYGHCTTPWFTACTLLWLNSMIELHPPTTWSKTDIHKLNVTVEQLALLLYIWQALGSNVNSERSYGDWDKGAQIPDAWSPKNLLPCKKYTLAGNLYSWAQILMQPGRLVQILNSEESECKNVSSVKYKHQQEKQC